MKKTIMNVAWAVILAIIVSACAKAPQEDLDRVSLAIEEARTAGADIYVPEEFAALQDSLMAVKESIEEKKSNWFASFSDEKEMLARLEMDASTTRTNAETRKTEVMNEIESLLTEVKQVLEENKALIAQAPRGKEGAAALEMINSENTALEQSVAEASRMFENGDYLPTLQKLQLSREKAFLINEELTEVIAKYSKKKGARS